MWHRGFTLLELLVVISIIAILVGLGLAAVGPLRQAARRNTTQAIMQGIEQALQVRAAKYGGLIAPTEHPLAGSKAPRASFVRSDGSALGTTGTALVGVLPSLLNAADRPRLLRPDDHHADAATPHLYGMRRETLGILGAGLAEVTEYRVLPEPLGGGTITTPDTVGRLDDPDEDVEAVARMMNAVLGTTLPDLVKLGAIYEPPDDTNLIANDRVWSPAAAGVEVKTVLQAKVGGVFYRLRGIGIYDAWGTEILCGLIDRDTILLTSAGRDGHFRWHPGQNGSFQTAAEGDSASGDDRDASQDNIRIGR